MPAEASAPVRPFTISVPQEVLDDLHERLHRTRFPGEVPGSGWRYGTNLGYLRELVTYWLNEYDWRTHEAALNAMPQFTTDLGGTTLHFVHARGKGPRPLPLLLCHGWPGSFYEMAGVLGPLTDPAAHGGDPEDAFDVVVPSLPGYGFSPDPARAGVGPAAIAELLTSLMRDTLGYERFALQGGDWGSLITTRIAAEHPEAVVGLHLNFGGGRATPPGQELSPEESSFREAAQRQQPEETGYSAIQGSRPQTLAYALTDSPAGLAAWIVEKFRVWSGSDDIEQHFSKDQLLTNIMIYWVTGSIGSSIRLYYEARHAVPPAGGSGRIEVPTAYAAFPGELAMWRPPRSLVERSYNLVRWTEMPRGGHFAAMEAPELLVADVRAFFHTLR